ncbi:MAG: S8 family serine peptidase [Desulfamplus sp.]|nr:S8 family serine peptidase [Desulfamplus sp.]
MAIYPAQSVNSSDWAFSFGKSDNIYLWSDVVELSELNLLSTGRGVTVAIIDSGIDIYNPIFSNQLWQNSGEAVEDEILIADGLDSDKNGYIDDLNGWNFGDNNSIIADQNGHGTNVAGVIIRSVPDANIMALKINPQDSYTFYTDAVIKAIYYAVDNGADVINMSLSLANDSIEVEDAIHYAIKNGIIVISAAGNSPYGVSFPGIIEEVITVGATTSDGKYILWNSPTGDAIDITAPGKSVESVGLYGEKVFVTGTSFSAPMVSGAAAALMGMNPALKIDTIKSLIFHGAKDMGKYGKDEEFGWGLLSGKGIKEVATPSITVKNSSANHQNLGKRFEISCYLPPTDSYTDVYIALVKSQNNEKNEIDLSNPQLIWWLDSDGSWKNYKEYGVISVASLRLDNQGLSVLLFSDSGGIWEDFTPSEFDSGAYNVGIALIKDYRLLAPIFWTPVIIFNIIAVY